MSHTNRDAGRFHAVKFYESPESLCRIAAEFLGEGLLNHQPALVVATPEHCTGIAAELRARRLDVEALQAAGDLLLLDAAETLASFMVDGMLDAGLFASNLSGAIGRVTRQRPDCSIRAYGDMVDVLWKAGQEVAAIRLEMLWNKLVASHDFRLLCGYAMGSFYKDVGLQAIHHQHSHIVANHASSAPKRDVTSGGVR